MEGAVQDAFGKDDDIARIYLQGNAGNFVRRRPEGPEIGLIAALAQGCEQVRLLQPVRPGYDAQTTTLSRQGIQVKTDLDKVQTGGT